MRYTLRGIPKALDLAVRERARREGKTLNEVAIAALAEGLGLAGARQPRRNPDDVVGTWKEDAVLGKALDGQDRIDPDLWT